MKWLIEATAILCIPISTLSAQPSCGSSIVLGYPFPAPQIVSDDLAVSLHDDALSIWPTTVHTKLNWGLAVELEFSDRTVCAVNLTAALAHGVTIQIARRDVSAVEAAVCDDDDGFCVPVRIVFAH